MPPSRVLRDLIQRRDHFRQWLFEQAPEAAESQSHLDPDSPAHAYWHHGYQSALDDIIDLLTTNGTTCNEDRPSH